MTSDVLAFLVDLDENLLTSLPHLTHRPLSMTEILSVPIFRFCDWRLIFSEVVFSLHPKQ